MVEILTKSRKFILKFEIYESKLALIFYLAPIVISNLFEGSPCSFTVWTLEVDKDIYFDRIGFSRVEILMPPSKLIIISIWDKNVDLLPNFPFLTKILIFNEILHFWTDKFRFPTIIFILKLGYLTKISILDLNFTFLTKV